MVKFQFRADAVVKSGANFATTDDRTELARVTAERDALRAIVAGRTVAPTDAEIDAHDGPWLVVLDHRAGHRSRVVRGDDARQHADRQRELGRAWVWHPFDERDGAIVAWPVVDR